VVVSRAASRSKASPRARARARSAGAQLRALTVSVVLDGAVGVGSEASAVADRGDDGDDGDDGDGERDVGRDDARRLSLGPEHGAELGHEEPDRQHDPGAVDDEGGGGVPKHPGGVVAGGGNVAALGGEGVERGVGGDVGAPGPKADGGDGGLGPAVDGRADDDGGPGEPPDVGVVAVAPHGAVVAGAEAPYIRRTASTAALRASILAAAAASAGARDVPRRLCRRMAWLGGVEMGS
jgi:hypothetical protein